MDAGLADAAVAPDVIEAGPADAGRRRPAARPARDGGR
jgi:hypothetical protein